MPKKSHQQAIGRLLEILKRLPTRGAGISAKELTDWLIDEGFEVSKRTVERDLSALAVHFQLVYNDKSIPYGWRWMSDAVTEFPALTVADAMSLHLVEDLLAPLLPAALLDSLRPRFYQARKKLDSLSKEHPNSRWLDKVRHVSPTLPLLPPQIAEGVMESVQEGLLADRQLEIEYQRPGDEVAQVLRLHPLGLVQRGPVTYLVATAFSYTDVRLYAVHRIGRVKVLEQPSQRPEGFSLDDYIAQGALQFGNGETIRLVARVSPWLADILTETPLTAEQRLEPDGQEFRLTATINDSWQLRWWVLSQGQGITVLEPEALKRDIVDELKRTQLNYKRLSRSAK